MPPTTRPKRVSAPPSRVYVGVDPMEQQHFKPRRQKVYGKHSLGAPRTKKQETLTQIGFVNPTMNDREIEEDIEEFEREDRERAKRRKTGTPRQLGAKHVLRRSFGQGIDDLPANLDDEAPQLHFDEQARAKSVPIAEPKPRKKKGKSTKGIQIRVVMIKKEPVESQDQDEQHPVDDTELVEDSFPSPHKDDSDNIAVAHTDPVIQPKKPSPDLDTQIREGTGSATNRRRSIIPDSDAESDEDEIVPDSNEQGDEDVDIVMDSGDELKQQKVRIAAKQADRVIPDSEAESDEEFDAIEDSQLPPLVNEEAIRDSFVVKDSFAARKSVAVAKSFRSSPPAVAKKPPRTVVEDSFATTSSLRTQSTHSSDFASEASDIVAKKEKSDATIMPPPTTPSCKRILEIPSSQSPDTPLSGKSIRTLTPSSARTIYTRSPLKRMHENVLPLSVSLNRSPRFNASQRSQRSLRSQKSAIHESQISTQDPTQSPALEMVPDSSPIRTSTPRDQFVDAESQNTAASDTPSKQLHSELSASTRRETSSVQPPSSSHTIRVTKRTTKTEIADSQDEDSDFELSTQNSIPSSSQHLPSSPVKKVAGTPAPKAVRFRDTPAYAPESEIRSPAGRQEEVQVPSSAEQRPTPGGNSLTGLESQWAGDHLLPDSLLADSLSLPPILDDDEVWDEI